MDEPIGMEWREFQMYRVRGKKYGRVVYSWRVAAKSASDACHAARSKLTELERLHVTISARPAGKLEFWLSTGSVTDNPPYAGGVL